MLRCSATRAMTRTLHEPWPKHKRPPSARDPPSQSAAPQKTAESISRKPYDRAGGHGLPQAQSESSAPIILEMRSLGVSRPILIGLAPCATETIAMTAQPLYAALDISLEKTTVCVMARDGATIQEAVVPSDPAALAACLAQHLGRLERIGLEA